MVDQVELLAERCEQATGADRDLDALIAMRFGTQRYTAQYISASAARTDEWARGPNDLKSVASAFAVPAFTASIDAAMTLVDPDVFFHLSRFSPGNGPANAHVYPNRCLGDDYEADAATPALALCAAALRARTPTTPERSDG